MPNLHTTTTGRYDFFLNAFVFECCEKVEGSPGDLIWEVTEEGGQDRVEAGFVCCFECGLFGFEFGFPGVEGGFVVWMEVSAGRVSREGEGGAAYVGGHGGALPWAG